MIDRWKCPGHHRGGLPRGCLRVHVNEWAIAWGFDPIDDDVLTGWRRADLLAAPTQVPIGGPDGTTYLWPTLNYRRAIRLLVAEACGESARRHQRLGMRLHGASIPDRVILADLQQEVRLLVRRINRALCTSNVLPMPGQLRPRRVYEREASTALGRRDPDSIRARLTPLPPPAGGFWERLVEHPVSRTVCTTSSC